MVRDASAYYLLGYASPAPFDGKFHKIKVRVKKDGYEVRARSGYFTSTPGDMERERGKRPPPRWCRPTSSARSTNCPPPHAAIASSICELGMSRGPDGRTRVTITGRRGRRRRTAGDVTLTISATVPGGAKLFHRRRTSSREVSFDAPAGDLVIATTARNGRGDEIDGDVRRMKIPAFDDSTLAIGSPVVLRAQHGA